MFEKLDGESILQFAIEPLYLAGGPVETLR
jgi:hypothetical protein